MLTSHPFLPLARFSWGSGDGCPWFLPAPTNLWGHSFPISPMRPSQDTPQKSGVPLLQTPVISTDGHGPHRAAPSSCGSETHVAILHHCSTRVTVMAATMMGTLSAGITHTVLLEPPASKVSWSQGNKNREALSDLTHKWDSNLGPPHSRTSNKGAGNSAEIPGVLTPSEQALSGSRKSNCEGFWRLAVS